MLFLAATKKGKKKSQQHRQQHVVASCVPSVVNSHLSPSNVVNGLVLNGAVESVEEKGFRFFFCQIVGVLMLQRFFKLRIEEKFMSLIRLEKTDND